MPTNAGYTLKCKSCGFSWQFSHLGYFVNTKTKLARFDLTPDKVLDYHADHCCGKTLNELEAARALEESEIALCKNFNDMIAKSLTDDAPQSYTYQEFKRAIEESKARRTE